MVGAGSAEGAAVVQEGLHRLWHTAHSDVLAKDLGHAFMKGIWHRNLLLICLVNSIQNRIGHPYGPAVLLEIQGEHAFDLRISNRKGGNALKHRAEQ